MERVNISPYLTEEHQLFKESLRSFLSQNFESRYAGWEKEGRVPGTAWKALGEMGYLGLCHEEKYGGLDLDWFYQVILCEELGRTGNAGFAVAVAVHEYMATNHIAHAGNDYHKRTFLSPAIEGAQIGALGMTEPHAGSDLRGLKTVARREGDDFLISGSKIFITNGFYADFITICARSENGLSLFVFHLDEKGISRNKLDKLGWRSSDTAEIFFDNVRVPSRNLLGEEGRGFYYLSESLQTERLVLSVISLGIIEKTLKLTKDYLYERKAFGKSLSHFQALRHRLADLETQVEALRQLIYHTAWLMEKDVSAVRECSMCKLYSAELHKRVADECLQMFGGYGYMEEYPIAQIYRDARAAPIVGGTSEVMREIIAKMSLDGVRYQKAY